MHNRGLCLHNCRGACGGSVLPFMHRTWAGMQAQGGAWAADLRQLRAWKPGLAGAHTAWMDLKRVHVPGLLDALRLAWPPREDSASVSVAGSELQITTVITASDPHDHALTTATAVSHSPAALLTSSLRPPALPRACPARLALRRRKKKRRSASTRHGSGGGTTTTTGRRWTTMPGPRGTRGLRSGSAAQSAAAGALPFPQRASLHY